jgi:Ca2+-binding RTX toxin-like protein
MRGTFTASYRRSRRGDRSSLIAAVSVLGLAILLAAAPALAVKYNGTKRSETVIGTQKSDTINGRGGNDLIKGRGGGDRLIGGKGTNKLVGGKGNDKVLGGPLGDILVGGPGVDSHVGGAGNDLLNAEDGRLDRVIDAGTGTNKCIIDVIELSIARGCGTVQASLPGGQGGPGGGGGGGGGPGGGGGGGGPGPGQGLRVLTVDVTCSPAPDVLGCSFHITGDGADAAGPGSVTGGGGVTNVVGAAGSLMPPAWDALGGYTCTAAGFLRVTIGAESVDVPVPCTPASLPI